MGDRLSESLRDLGGTPSIAAVPDPLPLDHVRQWVAQGERLLRHQYGDAFPEEWDRELGAHSTSSNVGTLRRWAVLKRLEAEHKELHARQADPEQAETAARQLLRREPVDVEIAGVTRQVWGRSYSAYQEIAQHQLRIDLIEKEIEDTRAELLALEELHGSLHPARFMRRRRVRGAIGELLDASARAQSEILRHRERIYAHAFNPSPAPADVTAPAPSWWQQASQEDDVRLILALFIAGRGRYDQLGRAPESDSKVKRMEEMGFASLFASIEKDRGLEPAVLYDRDLFQHLTAARAGAVDFSRDD